MRYTLRNQKKIIKAYDDKLLHRIITSLEVAVSEEKFEIHKECKPYPILDINDVGNTCGLILFHVINKKFDVLTLAFKEFVN